MTENEPATNENATNEPTSESTATENATKEPAATENATKEPAATENATVGSSTRRDASGRSGSGSRGATRVGLESLVRDGEAVFDSCPYCERPFATADAYALHVGEAHADACTASEREAYADALAAEEDELFYFHLRVVAGLAALYTVVVLAYMVALGSGLI
jgi:uncharacterized C2H2 Zn-finger protein